jgi:hypothetical protein
VSVLQWCERVQDAWLSRFISETTWGYPIVGAIHVLAIAVFGGAVLLPSLRVELRQFRRIGLVLVLVTGLLLFASGAARYYKSTSFRVKLVLLAILAVNAAVSNSSERSRLRSTLTLALWVAVIFAARGIAFY